MGSQAEPAGSNELQRLRAENDRLKRELADARSRVAVGTIYGMTDLLLLVGPAGQVVYANAAAESHYGVGQRQLVGRQIEQLSSAYLPGPILARLVHEARASAGPLSIDLEPSSPVQHGQEGRYYQATATPTPQGVQLLVADKTELRRMKQTLSRYLSPHVLEAVLKSGIDPYKARKYELTVLFADLRGFTSLSSQLPAEQVKYLIDEYLTVQIDIVMQEGATLDKIVGDEVMALFGAPLPNSDHALWAVNTALKLREGHRRLLELWTKRGVKACPVGIGINSGEMVVGHIGSREQMNYTVLGHNVNLGARLCSAAEGMEILLSQRTFELARESLSKNQGAIWRPIKFVRGKVVNAKGIAEPVQTVSVLDA